MLLIWQARLSKHQLLLCSNAWNRQDSISWRGSNMEVHISVWLPVPDRSGMIGLCRTLQKSAKQMYYSKRCKFLRVEKTVKIRVVLTIPTFFQVRQTTHPVFSFYFREFSSLSLLFQKTTPLLHSVLSFNPSSPFGSSPDILFSVVVPSGVCQPFSFRYWCWTGNHCMRMIFGSASWCDRNYLFVTICVFSHPDVASGVRSPFWSHRIVSPPSPWRIRHRVPRSLHQASPLPYLGLPVFQGTHDLFCCRKNPVVRRMFLQMVDGGLLGNLAVLRVFKLVSCACCEIGIGILGFAGGGYGH